MAGYRARLESGEGPLTGRDPKSITERVIAMSSTLPFPPDLSEEPDHEYWHGTPNGVTKRGCRGPKCRAAYNTYMREYMRGYRARKRAEREAGGAE